MFIFSIFWMFIILRLICEILSGIAVEIRFIWDSKHGVYGAASFIAIVTLWYLRKDMRKCTSVILYMNMICIAQWLFDPNFEILHCSGASARRHQHCKPQCSFMQTRVDHFVQRKYDVISPLRHRYAKDPLCVTRLILSFKVKVKGTRSLTLVSFERVLLVEHACQIWSLYLLLFKSYSEG